MRYRQVCNYILLEEEYRIHVPIVVERYENLLCCLVLKLYLVHLDLPVLYLYLWVIILPNVSLIDLYRMR